MRSYLVVTGVLFGAIGLAHLLRLIYASPVQIGAAAVPMWLSVIGLVVAGGLCICAFALVRQVKGP